MYAVVAPGLRGIYDDPKVIDRILKLYPYTKFRKFRTEEECWEFLARYSTKRAIEDINDYGDTFHKHHVVMDYYISPPNLYYNFNTKGIGTLRLKHPDALIENRTELIKVMLPNIQADPDKISGHIVAIYNGIKLLGDFIDVEVVVPDHSIFYAMRSYTGTSRPINRLQDYIKSRAGKVSVTLRR